jgi:hypothetical protein
MTVTGAFALGGNNYGTLTVSNSGTIVGQAGVAGTAINAANIASGKIFNFIWW